MLNIKANVFICKDFRAVKNLTKSVIFGIKNKTYLSLLGYFINNIFLVNSLTPFENNE